MQDCPKSGLQQNLQSKKPIAIYRDMCVYTHAI